jgi:hypothetical protein
METNWSWLARLAFLGSLLTLGAAPSGQRLWQFETGG